MISSCEFSIGTPEEHEMEEPGILWCHSAHPVLSFASPIRISGNTLRTKGKRKRKNKRDSNLARHGIMDSLYWLFTSILPARR
jgi:hypothetical protein